jgi:sugar transferase (PEP-CTERM/EpsH1 system associated)
MTSPSKTEVELHFAAERLERPLRVAHIVLSLDCGGLERMVLGLVRAGCARGQKVSVVCLEHLGALAAQAEQAGAHVLCADKRPGLRPRTVGRLKAIFRELAPDAVHTHQIGALLYAGPAARRAGVPVIIHTEHGNHLKGLAPWHRRVRARLLWRLAARAADRFFCVSADIAATLKAAGIPPTKLAVMPNGIAPAEVDRTEVERARRSLGWSEDARIVGTVGRLSPIKRQDLLVRAFALLHRTRPEARLLIVGDGPEAGALRQLSTALGIAEAVHFAGYHQRPELYLRLMDVFALSSDSEGMPMALLEAWAAGVPVVSTNVGGIPELIEEGRTGLLVGPGNDEALAAALKELLADPARARALGEAGRAEVVKRFGLDRTVAAYEAAYCGSTTTRPEEVPCASSC